MRGRLIKVAAVAAGAALGAGAIAGSVAMHRATRGPGWPGAFDGETPVYHEINLPGTGGLVADCAVYATNRELIRGGAPHAGDVTAVVCTARKP